LQIKSNIFSCQTADSKPVKQEVNSTVILPSLVFPGLSHRRDGGVQVLTGLVSSSHKVDSLLRTPYMAYLTTKNLAKSEFGEFTSMVKCAQLIFLKSFQQNKKFHKPPYYQTFYSHNFFCIVISLPVPNTYTLV
jgi:hypothetical protein